MTEPIILSIILVVSFVGITIWRTKELPESISAMVWSLKGDWKWLWSVWLMAVSIFTFAPVIEILDARGLGFLGFLPAVCLAFVGAMPLFDVSNRKWHYTLAIIGGILSQVSVLVISPWWLLLWALMLGYVVCAIFIKKFQDWMDGKGVLIAECICYLGVIGAQICYTLIR